MAPFTRQSATRRTSGSGPSSPVTRSQTRNSTTSPTSPIPSTPHVARRRRGSTTGGITVTVTNVVGTGNTNCLLDVKYIALHARNTEYKRRFPSAVILALREPRCKILLFKSGKMVITGVRDPSDGRLAYRKVIRILQKIGFTATYLPADYKVVNYFASVNVGFPIRLEGIALEHRWFATYEPEIFPSLNYRFEKPRGIMLIFHTGKAIMAGFKGEEELDEAFEKIYPVLRQFRQG